MTARFVEKRFSFVADCSVQIKKKKSRFGSKPALTRILHVLSEIWYSF